MPVLNITSYRDMSNVAAMFFYVTIADIMFSLMAG